MTRFNLSQTAQESVLATFRYNVSVFIYDANGQEKMTNIGDYLVSSKEEPTSLKLTSVMSNKSQDLLDILNKDSEVSKIIIQRRDEKDNIVITSTYNVGEMTHWETYTAAQDSGVSVVKLRGKCSPSELVKLEDLISALESQGVKDTAIQEAVDLLSKDNSINLSLSGEIINEDCNYGNKCATVNMTFAVNSYKHKIGE